MKQGKLSFTLSWDLSHENSKQSCPNEPLKDDIVLGVGKMYWDTLNTVPKSTSFLDKNCDSSKVSFKLDSRLFISSFS